MHTLSSICAPAHSTLHGHVCVSSMSALLARSAQGCLARSVIVSVCLQRLASARVCCCVMSAVCCLCMALGLLHAGFTKRLSMPSTCHLLQSRVCRLSTALARQLLHRVVHYTTAWSELQRYTHRQLATLTFGALSLQLLEQLMLSGV